MTHCIKFPLKHAAHVAAGRATDTLPVDYAIAKGSNQNMGLDTYGVYTKLRMTGADYDVIDTTCP